MQFGICILIIRLTVRCILAWKTGIHESHETCIAAQNLMLIGRLEALKTKKHVRDHV